MTRVKFTIDLALPSNVEPTYVLGAITELAEEQLGCEVRGEPGVERLPDLRLIEGEGDCA